MDLESMTVADLKRELKARNLVQKGAKAELIERLRAALGDHPIANQQPNHEISLGDDNLPDGDLSDEGLLNDEELLQDTTSPSKPQAATATAVPITPMSPPKVDQAPAVKPVMPVIKTASALQKEGILQPMEDDLFSDRPPASPPPMRGGNGRAPIGGAPPASDDKLKARAARFGLPEAKLEERAKKFGLPQAKLEERAKKFGTGGKIGDTPVVDKEKLLERAKRFGLTVAEDGKVPKPAAAAPAAAIKSAAPVAAKAVELKPEDVEKLRKRSERFGTTVAPAIIKAEESEKLAKRKNKFESAGGDAAPPPAKISAPAETVISEPKPPSKHKPIVF